MTMRRTNFAGALVVIAIGAVLAFAIHSSPKDFDLQIGGQLLMLGGAADLLIRSLIADRPLPSRQSTGVAAVVEPLGDPVLDEAGNQIAVTNPADTGRPPLTDDPYSAVRIPSSETVTTLDGRPVRPRGRALGAARRRRGRSW